MVTSRLRRAVALFFVYFVSYVNGSAIVFQSTPNSINPLVPGPLTVRCSIHDTSSVVQPVVGRSVTSLDDSDAREDDVTTDDTQIKLDNNDRAKRSLTNTSADVMFATSIIISRDGTDLATIIEHFPAHADGGATGFQVSGQLSATSGEKGFLELVWPHPTQADTTGNFRCDIDTLSHEGHSFDFSQNLVISKDVVTLDDVVNHLQTVERENKATIAMMNKTLNELKTENAALKQSVVPNVFFSAAVTHTTTVAATLVYNKVFVNEGGAYDNSTGTFTCPISGFYHFEINAGGFNKELKLILHRNNENFITAMSSGHGFTGSSNSGIVQLVKGDTMQVLDDWHSSYVWASNSDALMNTLTGRLIAVA